MNLKPLIAASMVAFGGYATAAGVGKLSVSTTNDRFDNQGNISATAQASGGVATAMAAQRIVAPVLSFSVDYRSSGNRYTNRGNITATSRASGGVATASAGQDIVH